MTDNLEATLTKVNKFININKNRAKYTHHYDTLRNTIFEQLLKQELLKSLFNGHSLQGSYGDNLKVNMPDEFDSVFVLKLPAFKLAKIEKDHHNAGNVLINLADLLEKIKNETHHKDVYTLLKKWVNERNFLIVEKVQAWLTGCFQKVLTSLEHKIVVKNIPARLSYSRQGPAHTIKVSGDGDFFYSVDFVPGFIFTENQNVFKGVKGTWLAIPKPMKPPQPNSISFRSSFFVQESEIIKNSKNLKNVLRMVKKFRDCHMNMANLKSYYIKTIFLMKAKQHEKDIKDYWESPISKIVIEIFHDLEETLIKKKLPFFWDKQCNMYQNYSNIQMQEMQKFVANTKAILLRGQSSMDNTVRFKIYSSFLTAKERVAANITRPNGIKSNIKEGENVLLKCADKEFKHGSNNPNADRQPNDLPDNSSSNTKSSCCIA